MLETRSTRPRIQQSVFYRNVRSEDFKITSTKEKGRAEVNVSSSNGFASSRICSFGSSPSTRMTVTKFLTLCPEKSLSGSLFSSALFPFTRPSSVPVTSGRLILISATSTLFYVFNISIIICRCQLQITIWSYPICP